MFFKKLIKSYAKEQGVFTLLMLVLVVSVFSYGYLVRSIVRDVVAKNITDREISELDSVVAELEYSYISMKNSITLEYAKSAGFEDSKNILYVSRTPETKGLSVRSGSN